MLIVGLTQLSQIKAEFSWSHSCEEYQAESELQLEKVKRNLFWNLRRSLDQGRIIPHRNGTASYDALFNLLMAQVLDEYFEKCAQLQAAILPGATEDCSTTISKVFKTSCFSTLGSKHTFSNIFFTKISSVQFDSVRLAPPDATILLRQELHLSRF